MRTAGGGIGAGVAAGIDVVVVTAAAVAVVVAAAAAAAGFALERDFLPFEVVVVVVVVVVLTASVIVLDCVDAVERVDGMVGKGRTGNALAGITGRVWGMGGWMSDEGG